MKLRDIEAEIQAEFQSRDLFAHPRTLWVQGKALRASAKFAIIVMPFIYRDSEGDPHRRTGARWILYVQDIHDWPPDSRKAHIESIINDVVMYIEHGDLTRGEVTISSPDVTKIRIETAGSSTN